MTDALHLAIIISSLLWSVVFVVDIITIRSLARSRAAVRTQRDILIDALEDICRDTCGDPPTAKTSSAAAQCLQLLQSHGRVHIRAVQDGRVYGHWTRHDNPEDDQ